MGVPSRATAHETYDIVPSPLFQVIQPGEAGCPDGRARSVYPGRHRTTRRRKLLPQTQEPVMNLNSLSLPAGPAPMKPATVRRLGMALIVIGALLALGVGYMALQLAPTL